MLKYQATSSLVWFSYSKMDLSAGWLTFKCSEWTHRERLKGISPEPIGKGEMNLFEPGDNEYAVFLL